MTSTLTPLSLREIRDLVRPMAATASVYLGPRQDRTDDGGREMVLRRRRIARDLGEQGADSATIDVALGFLARLPEQSHGYALFAQADRIVLAHQIDTAATDDAAYGTPPRVASLLAWLQHHPAAVLVRVERAGAELLSIPAGADTGSRRSVVGPDDDIRRHFAGGGQQPRLERRAENAWRHNAAAVAAVVGEEIDRVHARLVLTCGDPRAILLLTEFLRQAGCRCAIRHLPPAHTVGAGCDPMTFRLGSPAAEAVAVHVRDETAYLLERVAQRIGAVQGEQAVLETLAEGSARVLLIHDDPERRRGAWFGPGVLCAAHPVPGLALRQGRIADVAIRAALLTGCEVRILTPVEASGVDSGIAALLRHS